MIAYTTPTIPIVVTSGQLLATKCDIYVSFRQGDTTVTVEPSHVSADVEGDKTLLLCDLGQLQTGGLSFGATDVQVNVVDWMGYRAATPWKKAFIGSNLIEREISHER